MERLLPGDFDQLDKCPWDGDTSDNFSLLYKDIFGCEICCCEKCGIIFAKQRLNKSGLQKYWADYESRVHSADSDAVLKRAQMYKIDYAYVRKYRESGNVLDVGCGNGDFLALFKNDGYKTFGVEYGKEASQQAAKRHRVWQGSFPEFVTEEKFDIIIFRGVLQYVLDAKEYLNKAISLLSHEGIIFITAQPNMGSFCFKLFKEKFTQPVTGVDFIGYTEPIFTQWFTLKGFSKIAEAYFYESTPYANMEEDILSVARAIRDNRQGNSIRGKSPAFWGNMMTLIYQKK